MALDLRVTYPDQTAEDANYPQGAAQNISVEDDGTGFPLEKTWINDHLGFQQALLLKTGITPSGDPDNANVSQYLQAVQWLADRSRTCVSVKEPTFGAIGNGSTNDRDAIQDAIDFVHAAGGGTVYFPPGTYRIESALQLSPLVNLLGLPGFSTIRMHHATQRFFVMAAAWTKFSEIFGIDFEGSTANTGEFFYEAGSGIAMVAFRRCRLNRTTTNLGGQLFFSVSDTRIVLEDCDFVAVKTDTHHISISRVELRRGSLTMAPAATDALLNCVNSLEIDGTKFVQVSTVGDVAFIKCGGGTTKLSRLTFDVNDDAAGSNTYAIELDGGKVLMSQDSDLATVTPYLLSSAAAVGSELQLLPYREFTDNDTAISVSSLYRTTVVRCSSATAPTITIEEPLVAGQELEVITQNNSGSQWATGAGFAAPVADSEGLAVGSGEHASYRFRGAILTGSDLTWVQLGGTFSSGS